MQIRLPGEPDRLIDDLYVWVVQDTRTKLEGIFSISAGGMSMQCATSSLEMAIKVGESIKGLPYSEKEFTLYRYKKDEAIKII